jgi:hypothetical protein
MKTRLSIDTDFKIYRVIIAKTKNSIHDESMTISSFIAAILTSLVLARQQAPFDVACWRATRLQKCSSMSTGIDRLSADWSIAFFRKFYTNFVKN